MMKVLIITSVPSPYRITLFDQLDKQEKIHLIVLYLGQELVNLKWTAPKLAHKHVFLKKPNSKVLNKYGYRKGIWEILKKFEPDIIITGGFNISMLIAILYTYIYSLRHYITTDAWEHTEKTYSFFHIAIRKILYKRAAGFFPVSIKGSEHIIENYKIKKEKVYIIPYTPPIDNFFSVDQHLKEFDIMFSGQFIKRKMPSFVCEIAKELKNRGHHIKVLLLGTGELANEVTSFLKDGGINYEYPGFVQTEELPIYYSKAKIFLFPTESDGWGIVANEALAAGLPVLTCDNAGASGELIVNNYNGFVLPLDVNDWVDHIIKLLTSKNKYDVLSKNAIKQAKKYSAEKAARDLITAISK